MTQNRRAPWKACSRPRAGEKQALLRADIVRNAKVWIILEGEKGNRQRISTGEIEKLYGEAMAAGALAESTGRRRRL